MVIKFWFPSKSGISLSAQSRRSALFRDIARRCPETSANSYHTTPRNIPEERRSHQRRGGSLKSSSVELLKVGLGSMVFKISSTQL
jgi:hypothetical protein